MYFHARQVVAKMLQSSQVPLQITRVAIEQARQVRQRIPLILSRLELIEEIAPDSMDAVNLAAFEEAYKDLVNMLAKLQR